MNMNSVVLHKFLHLKPFYDASCLIYIVPRFSHLFHTSSRFKAVNKLQLSKLRKKTGFAISHCKKALELNENDLQKAEEWLQKEAQAHGWAKATKLSARATTQGLIGIHINRNVASLIELNCETDFVAKNAEFQGLVSRVTKEFASTSTQMSDNVEEPIKKIVDGQTLGGIKTNEGKTLSDLVALSIGKIGENIQLARGVKFVCPPGLDLIGYTHPPPPKDGSLFGKYAAVVAFKNVQDINLARQLCAHIIGMHPETIGSLDDLEEKGDSDTEAEKEEEKNVEGEEDESPDERKIREDAERYEKTLVRQMFLSNQELKVGEVLKENDLQIVDFIRLECGEYQGAAN